MAATDPPPIADAVPDPNREPAVPPIARWIAAGVVGVMIVLSFIQARKHDAQLADFGAYYRAGQALAAGRTPYFLDPKFGALGAYMYCPAFAFVACRPLAALPYPWAVRAFLVVNWLATVGVMALSMRLARAQFWSGLIACAAVGMYLWSDLHNGQVGTLLLLACLGWITLTLAGRPVLGGVSLSLAVGLKIYPLLLGPYLLFRRQWWPGLIGLALGLALQFVTPALFVGGRGLLPLHREWLKFCVTTQVPQQTYRAGNQSLLAVLARSPWVSNGTAVYSDDRLHQLEHVYPVVVVALTGVLFAGLLLRRARDPVADVSVLLIWMTLASPRAWTFNFAAELPVAVLLGTIVMRRGRGWPLAIIGLLSAVYAVAFDTNRLPPQQERWSPIVQFLFDKHFFAAVVLAIAVLLLKRREVAAEAATPVGQTR